MCLKSSITTSNSLDIEIHGFLDFLAVLVTCVPNSDPVYRKPTHMNVWYMMNQ